MSVGVGALGPGATPHMMTGLCRCIMDKDAMEDNGGGFGVLVTRSRVCMDTNRHARLRNTLGASGVVGSN